MASGPTEDAGPPRPDPDSLPSSDIEVEATVHFGMAGTFPMRMAELFFAGRGVYVAEYSYITPLLGVGTRKHRKNARAMRSLYERYGIDAVLLQADRVVWLDYDLVDRVRLYSGGWFGRPKVSIFSRDGPSYAYRLFGDRDFEAVAADVRSAAERHGVDLTVQDRTGFTPRRNVARFFGRERPPEDR